MENAPAAADDTCKSLRGSQLTQLLKKVGKDQNKKVAMHSGHWRSKVSLFRLLPEIFSSWKTKVEYIIYHKITLFSSI